MSEINVTPLVDVMLVLLIIFMITAPLIQQGVKVNLPEAKAAPAPTPQAATTLPASRFPAAAPAPAPSPTSGRAKASPLARRVARERGLDVAAIAGTGPGGRVVVKDLEGAGSGKREAAAPTAPAAPQARPAPTLPASRVPLPGSTGAPYEANRGRLTSSTGLGGRQLR